MHDSRETQFRSLLHYAETAPEVLGLFVFGSRGREDALRDSRSDYDVAVVLTDQDGAIEAFDEEWPYVHGASVEVARSTLGELREHGEYGTASAWARYQYAQVKLLVDKTGAIAPILAQKRRIPDGVRDRLVRDALDGYINFTYRSLRYQMVGAEEGARLDGAESLPYALTAIFALDGRVRPFNKYLASELRSNPLTDDAWAADALLPRLDAVLRGDTEQQRILFRDLERFSRERGFGEVVDGWQPDVGWLRGDDGYRSGSGQDASSAT